LHIGDCGLQIGRGSLISIPQSTIRNDISKSGKQFFVEILPLLGRNSSVVALT
jgi:hypothetical protein